MDIQTSTRPREAIDNARKLLANVDDSEEWSELAGEEAAQLRIFITQGQERLQNEKNSKQQRHIKMLIDELQHHLSLLEKAGAPFISEDDWEIPDLASVTSAPKVSNRRIALIIVTFGFIAIVINYGLTSGNKKPASSAPPIAREPQRVQLSAATSPTIDTKSTNIAKLAFNEIIRSKKNLGWTDVQFDKYRTDIHGLRAENWIGTIIDVKQAVMGDRYYVEVDMPGTDQNVDVFVYVPENLALQLRRGQELTFSGTIDGLYPSMSDNWSVEIIDPTLSSVSDPPSLNNTQSQKAFVVANKSTLGFDEIIRSKDKTGWTDVQFDQYKLSIKGLRAENWQGTIGDVKQANIGNRYYVEVDMPNTSDKVDVYLYVSENLALSLKKGQSIKFNGIIEGLYPAILENYKVEVNAETQ